MPELPEVEQVRRTLSAHLMGQKISAVRIFHPERVFFLSPVEFRKALTDGKVKKLARRGKCLLLQLDNQRTALVGLGMTGRFAVEPSLEPLDYLVAAFALGHGRYVKLYDVRRFCRLSAADSSRLEQHPFLAGLGWEFDDRKLTPKVLRKELGRFRSKSIKEVLLDQAVIAGIGNIYANEILHVARINPQKEARELTAEECGVLLGTARKLLQRAIELGGTTVRDFRDSEGKEGRYASELRVYLREGQPCLRCGKDSLIERIIQGGRSTFFCPRCQT